MFFNRLKSEIRNNASKNEAQILVDGLVNDDYSGSNDFNVPISDPGPGQNSMWSQPPFMANQIYPDQSMNLYRNQINQNPGWPGPGPYQNQVLPNQPGHNQTGNSNVESSGPNQPNPNQPGPNQPHNPGPSYQLSGPGWRAEVNNELREHLGRFSFLTAI